MEEKKAKEILGKNFIGHHELLSIREKLPIGLPSNLPPIPYSEEFLRDHKEDSILVFGPSLVKDGTPLTINFLREHFGFDPEVSEPCMYNQDWYLKEPFACNVGLQNKWYFIEKNIQESTRGVHPENIFTSFSQQEKFPLAILTTFTFFAYYLLNNGEILWKDDFIWCQDRDGNGDQIYTGRYLDSSGKNKNGFNIHRHLSIRKIYGAVKQY